MLTCVRASVNSRSDRSGDLSPEEFQRALREFGVRLSNGEVKQLFALFDTDGSGTIVYDEFVRGLRGGSTFSAAREAVVRCHQFYVCMLVCCEGTAL